LIYQRKIDQAITVEHYWTTPNKLLHGLSSTAEQKATSSFSDGSTNFSQTPRNPRKVQTLNGQHIKAYGQHKDLVYAQGTSGRNRTHTDLFEAVDIMSYDLILGFPWFRATNPIIDWVARTWEYRDISSDTKIEFISAQKAANTPRFF
jgi:hypothetical protein